MLNGHRIAVRRKGIVEIDGSDSWRTMKVYLMPLNNTLKIIEMVTFVCDIYFTTCTRVNGRTGELLLKRGPQDSVTSPGPC